MSIQLQRFTQLESISGDIKDDKGLQAVPRSNMVSGAPREGAGVLVKLPTQQQSVLVFLVHV